MQKSFEKTPDGKIKQIVSKTVVDSQIFDPSYLIKQRADILAQKAQQIAQRDQEIADIDEMLEQCKTFKLVNKTVNEDQTVEWSLPVESKVQPIGL